MSKSKLRRLLQLHDSGNSFVVKTHEGPSPYLKTLMNNGNVKSTLIYRDPRDVVLSAIEHGKKIRDMGKTHSFASCFSIQDTILQVKSWLDRSMLKWLILENVLYVKYENLLENPIRELERLGKFLNLNIIQIDLNVLLTKYNRKTLTSIQKSYLHFNIGQAERFRTTLSKKRWIYAVSSFQHT